jgi:hypothetical protein
MSRTDHDERSHQILGGLGVMTGLLGCIALVIAGSYLPGVVGEILRTVVGICTTPVFLEITGVVIGLLLVLGLNYWRQRRDGDELVYLEQVDGPKVPGSLPEHARFAVYPTCPEPGREPDALERADGSLAIGDTAAAAEALAELDEAALQTPVAIDLRVRLARATGRHALAAELEQRLPQPGQDPPDSGPRVPGV